MKSEFLLDIVETFVNRQSNIEFYRVLIHVLVSNGMDVDELHECFGVEEELDSAILGILEEYREEKEDEEDWPDGGREMF